MGRKILLVEGNDDQHVVKRICEKYDVPRIDEINPIGDVNKVIESFEVQIKNLREEGDVVGAIVDADVCFPSRWQSFRDRIVKAGYQDVPIEPPSSGVILSSPTGGYLPRMGVWIMPDNHSNGIMEDFLRFLVGPKDQLWPHAQNAVTKIPNTPQKFREIDNSKALIHTWLAWQRNPGRPFGLAIKARFLDAGVPEANMFASWIKRLFFT